MKPRLRRWGNAMFRLRQRPEHGLQFGLRSGMNLESAFQPRMNTDACSPVFIGVHPWFSSSIAGLGWTPRSAAGCAVLFRGFGILPLSRCPAAHGSA
jgi:hypothetical protein